MSELNEDRTHDEWHDAKKVKPNGCHYIWAYSGTAIYRATYVLDCFYNAEGRMLHNITHWMNMPVPAPPKPETKAEKPDPRKIAPNGRAMLEYILNVQKFSDQDSAVWGKDDSGRWW